MVLASLIIIVIIIKWASTTIWSEICLGSLAAKTWLDLFYYLRMYQEEYLAVYVGLDSFYAMGFQSAQTRGDW